MLIGALGGLYSFIYHALFSFGPGRDSLEGFPAAIKFAVYLEAIALGWPWGLLTSLLLVIGAARERFQGRTAWIASFSAGAVFASAILQGLGRIFGR